jgi:hypothetical protein
MGKQIGIVAWVAAAALWAAVPAVAEPPDREDSVEALAADVYVLVSGQLRNPVGTTPSSARLFNVAGTDLGMTWGQFRAVRARSKVRCTAGGRTNARIHLRGLVPDGVYSIFYGTFEPESRNPLCPNAERLLPLPSVDSEQEPDAASFVADEEGEAFFHGRVDGCLLEAGKLVFAAIYHFDGQTYGDLPNRGEFVTQGPDCRSSFGADAMRQTLITQKQ